MLAVAIDLGGTHATCALVRDASIIARHTVLPCGCGELKPFLPELSRTVQKLSTESGISLRECAGIALGFCGLADVGSGRVLATNGKYEDAPNIDLGNWSRTEFNLPFRIENDARMALLGEREAGAAAGYDDIVMMTLGMGIGGVAMIGGKLLRGKHRQAGCLGGHLAMNPRGRLCTCGALGCAETEASTWALPAICREWPNFEASRLAHEPKLNFATLFRVAEEGDAVASEIVAHSIDVWSALAVTLIHAYDPEVVVIGGGIMARADRILPAIRERVQNFAWTPWGKARVVTAQFGDEAALFGAIPLLREQLA